MGPKDIGKILKKLGKSKIAKEATKDVAEEGLKSVTDNLLKKNSRILNDMSNPWKSEIIDTAGALSHLSNTKTTNGKVEDISKEIYRRKGNKSNYPKPEITPPKNISEVIDDSQLLLNAPNKRVSSKKPIHQPEYDTIELGEMPKLQSPSQPKPRQPRRPRREYKPDLGTNTNPINLSGPVKKDSLKQTDHKRYRRVSKSKDIKQVSSLNATLSDNGTIHATSSFKNGEATYTSSIEKAPGKDKTFYMNVERQSEGYRSKYGLNPKRGSADIKEIKKIANEESSPKWLKQYADKNIPDVKTETVLKQNKSKKKKKKNKKAKTNKRAYEVIEKNNKARRKALESNSDVSPINEKPKTVNEVVNDTVNEKITEQKVQPNKPTEPKKVNVSLDDFKTEEEINQMEDVIKQTQLDRLEELRENGEISQEDYETAIDNVVNDSNMDIKVDEQIMNDQPELKNEPNPEPNTDVTKPEKQSRREQRKSENEKNNKKQTNTKEQQLKNREQIDITDSINTESEKIEQDAIDKFRKQFNPRPIGDNDKLAYFDRDGYSITMRNGVAESISVGDDTYEYLYNKDGHTMFRNVANDEFLEDSKMAQEFYDIGNRERRDYLKNLSDKDWKDITGNPEKFGFDKHNVDELGYDAHLSNEFDAFNTRSSLAEEKAKDIQSLYEKEKDKKIKKELADKRDKTKIKSLEAQKEANHRKAQYEARQSKKKAGEKFNKALDLDQFEKGSKEYYEALKASKGTAAYEEALKNLKSDLNKVNVIKNASIKNADKPLDGQIKGLSGKGMTLGKAVTIGLAAKTAVDKYKESKAEGKSTGSSLIRAGGAAVVGEILGPGGYAALTIGQAIPKLIVNGADALYKESRRMNSVSNITPLGGVSFQDSQELATMRQSGMELAKMSQYNLEQSLMGAEAKHLHR